MPSISILSAALAFNVLGSLAQPISERSNDSSNLIAELKAEGTRFERFEDILTDGETPLTGDALVEATVFDFNTQYPVPGGEEGTFATAYVDSFPMLPDSGISFTVATLGPCGVFFPHVHPRANELFTVIEGGVSFGTMLESPIVPTAPGAPKPLPPVYGTLGKFEGTVFPQGSIHYQINDAETCEPATIVATLSSDDAGTTAVLQQVDGQGTARAKGNRQAEIGEIEQYFPLLPPVIVDTAKKCVARCKA